MASTVVAVNTGEDVHDYYPIKPQYTLSANYFLRCQGWTPALGADERAPSRCYTYPSITYSL